MSATKSGLAGIVTSASRVASLGSRLRAWELLPPWPVSRPGPWHVPGPGCTGHATLCRQSNLHAVSAHALWGDGSRPAAGAGPTPRPAAGIGCRNGAGPQEAGHKYRATGHWLRRAGTGCGGRKRVEGWHPAASVAPLRVAASREKRCGRRGPGARGGADGGAT